VGDAPGGGLAWPPSRSPPRQFGQAQQPSEPGRRRAQRTPSLVHRWFAAAAEAPTAARRQEEPPSSRQRGAPGPPVSQCQELVLLSPSPPPSLKAWGHLSGVSNHRQREAAPRRVPARYQVPGTRYQGQDCLGGTFSSPERAAGRASTHRGCHPGHKRGGCQGSRGL